MPRTMQFVSNDALTSEEDVLAHIRGVCFKTGPPVKVGVELEWLLVHSADPATLIPLPEVAERLEALRLPGGSRITFEPGGQLELSSRPHEDPFTVVHDLAVDTQAVLDRLRPLDITISDRALDCLRPGVRQLDAPRYEAMEDYFAAADPVVGSQMMCCCVGLQVNLDCGQDPAAVAQRWRLLHDLGPTLIAAFANSPAPGWRSRRQGIWQELEPLRTAAPEGDDPVTGWTRYALRAPVMMIRGEQWLARPGFTFGEWLAGRTGFGQPTIDDLDYHLTTLFPPVRPRGWFEVRYLDAQPRRWWPVPVLVLWALMSDEAGVADAIDPDAIDAWDRAARSGLADPALAGSAVRLVDLALLRLGEASAPLVGEFAERYTYRGLAPADDELLHG